MNEQAAKLTRWLLAGNGALKNTAQLLIEAFGPLGAIAATIDAATITAYPVDPSATPQGQGWTPAEQGWAHPLHSQLLPRSTSAHHHVVAGITSRNEVLVVNLAAAGYLGIESVNPMPILRSWLIQTLSKTPAAVVAVTDAALAIAGAERLRLIEDPTAAPPDVSLLLTTGHTSTAAGDPPHPILVSAQGAGAANVVLCNEAVAGVYLANRYWPLWRRIEIGDPQWEHLKAVLAESANVAAETSTLLERQRTSTASNDPASRVNNTSPEVAAISARGPQRTAGGGPTSADATSPASGSLRDTVAGVEEPGPTPPRLMSATSQELPKPTRGLTPLPTSANVTSPTLGPLNETDPLPPLLTPDILAPLAEANDAIADNSALLPDCLGQEPTEPGLYVLGEVYALGLDPETGEAVKHTAVTRQGVRKPVKALMALATSNGIAPTEWEEKILQVTAQNRRQLRTQIRKMMGGHDPISNDRRGLLIVDMFCDWKEFNRLIGHAPESATTEALTAAIQLIRGAPFEDVPDEDYSWRSVQLLKDELIDRCSTAAAELAQRQQAAGAREAAYQTARLGIRVYSQREDLWLVAANSVTDADRKALIWDLKHAIPVPTHPELRQLLAVSRAS